MVIILALQGTSTAVQITATWNGGAGNWDTAGNWSGAVVPNNGLMRASNGGTLRALANVDIDAAPAGGRRMAVRYNWTAALTSQPQGALRSSMAGSWS